MTPRGHRVRDLAGQAPPWACGAAGGPSSHGPVIQDWEHHELRRSRRDLYHLSHEVALREAHAARQNGHAGWLAIGRAHVELQSLMRTSYAVIGLHRRKTDMRE